MKRLMLFAGTTEGRQLAQRAAALPLEVSVCVAGAYGREVLQGLPAQVRVHEGRLDGPAMAALLAGEAFGLVVDATHPYAAEVTANIRAAAKQASVPCLRLLRGAGGQSGGGPAACTWVPNMHSAASALAKTQGNVLLTTGSKDLAAFAALPNAAQRLYARVLPTLPAIRACEALGLPHAHILALQGPFSTEMNLAMLRQYNIAVLVTKDGGAPGGFAEKMLAAETLGLQAIVVGRPPDEGLSPEQVWSAIMQFAKETP